MCLYTRGKRTPNPKAIIPNKERGFFECWHEYIMVPGNSYTFPPKIPHWFQGGPKGSVIWSISTKVLDLFDEFTNPLIIRETIIKDN